MKKLFLPACAAAVVLAVSDARAEPPPLESRQPPRYHADVLVFHEEERDDALVWLVVNCPISSLFFEPGSESADVRLAWKILRGDRQVDGDVVVRRVEVDERRRDDLAILQTVPVRLPPGRYDVEIELGQAGSDETSSVTRELRVESIGKDPFVLSSLFVSAEPASGSRRRERGLPGFPLVSRVVHEDVATVSLVGEIYAPAGCRERYRVDYRLVDDYGNVAQQRTEEIPCEGFRTTLSLPLDNTKLVFGDYRVELTVEMPDAGKKINREIWFSADETLLPLRGSFRRALEVIESIADEDELRALRIATPDEREEIWEEFWRSRDPDADTPRNEFKDAFFQRLRYANQHFGTATTRGWRTDRGFILLKHGHPDRIERNQRAGFGADIRRTETWRYDSLAQTFLFADDDGFGDYRLVRTN